LGSLVNGILYVSFAASAILFGNPIVTAIGAKRSLVVGLTGYCIYVVGFLFAIIARETSEDIAWIIASSSAALGGLAGAMLWVGQGRSFAAHARLFSSASDLPIEKVNADFAGVFACYFLGIEMACKVLATALYIVASTWGAYVVFSVYTFLALFSVLYMHQVLDLDDTGSGQMDIKAISHYVAKGI
jgi:hypothetical protein